MNCQNSKLTFVCISAGEARDKTACSDERMRAIPIIVEELNADNDVGDDEKEMKKAYVDESCLCSANCGAGPFKETRCCVSESTGPTRDVHSAGTIHFCAIILLRIDYQSITPIRCFGRLR